MDPVIDNSRSSPAWSSAGISSCCRARLLALLLVRELATLLLARWGALARVDIEVNWFGRVAVFPVMGALFLG